MLETLRAYGQEQLARTGEDEAVRTAHATIVLEAMRAGTSGLLGPDAARWAETLEAEQDNLRAAFTWATRGTPSGHGSGADCRHLALLGDPRLSVRGPHVAGSGAGAPRVRTIARRALRRSSVSGRWRGSREIWRQPWP